MKTRRELSLHGEDTEILGLIDALGTWLGGGRRLDHDGAQWRSTGILTGVFECSETASRPSARLLLSRRKPGVFHVSDIVPDIHKGPLSSEDYDSILDEFAELLRRVAVDCGFPGGLKLTETTQTLGDWMSPEAAEKLRQFSATANRQVGAALPRDREKWLDFVFTAHRDGSKLDSSDLKRYLIEDGAWPPEVADRLAAEFDFGSKVLTFAEANLQPT